MDRFACCQELSGGDERSRCFRLWLRRRRAGRASFTPPLLSMGLTGFEPVTSRM